jgi:hypothetical protein
LRRVSEARTCIYELATEPAQDVLRKILGLSLRTLIEDLVLSNTAKYGTWQEVRLLDMPRNKAAGLHGVSAHVENKMDIWSFACVLSELCTFIVFGTAPSHDATQTHSILRRAAKNMLMRRDTPTGRLSHQSVQLLSRMQSATLSNTPTSVYWSPAGVYRPSKSTIFTTTDFLLLTDSLRLVLPKLHLIRGKAALSLRFGDLQDLEVSIAIHATKEGYHVSLQPAEAQKGDSSLRMANAGAIVDLVETQDSRECRCRSAASWRAWFQVCQNFPYSLECKC